MLVGGVLFTLKVRQTADSDSRTNRHSSVLALQATPGPKRDLTSTTYQVHQHRVLLPAQACPVWGKAATHLQHTWCKPALSQVLHYCSLEVAAFYSSECRPVSPGADPVSSCMYTSSLILCHSIVLIALHLIRCQDEILLTNFPSSILPGCCIS
jgi:hypothetical protein